MSETGRAFYEGVEKGLILAEKKIREILYDAQEKDQEPIKRALLGVVDLEDQLNSVDNEEIKEALRRIKLH